LQQQKLRVDAFLAARLPRVSRARLKDCISAGGVRVNGRTQGKASYRVKLGDKVECDVPPPRLTSADPENIPLDIVHEDDSVVVVNKPAGADSCVVAKHAL
jgi:23S rRNA pseudouridine1911/1915/1917 synthase